MADEELVAELARAPEKRCDEVNEVLKLRCDREAGHRGTHLQIDDNGTHAWGDFWSPGARHA